MFPAHDILATLPFLTEERTSHIKLVDTLQNRLQKVTLKKASVFIYTYHFVRVCAPSVAVNESQNHIESPYIDAVLKVKFFIL
jgi:hypothetical protein